MKKLQINIILFIFSVIGYSEIARSACTQNPQLQGLRVSVPAKSINIQYDNMSNNEVLYSSYIPFGISGTETHLVNSRDCGDSYIQGRYLSGWNVNANKIVPTNIDGIGIRVSAAAIGYFNTSFGPSKTGWRIDYNKWDFEVIKTKQVINSDYIKSGDVASLIITNSSPASTWNVSLLSIPANAIKINVLSCSLKNNKNTYDINMGDWYDTQFKNINDTQGTVAIPIALSCLSGTNIKVTVTSDTIDNAANGRLGLTGADKASGIAVQLLNNAGTPIVLNQKLTQQDNVAQGDYIFGWKARYIKTAATITPGTANANATVNIRYE
ncbi:type 1 fimbria pilin [Providencia alcalifaciens]|uniref:Type 1 fimbria pilin n=1 Tax=Providencia alcalifaciens TaxID=126385 RepID=A0A4R3NMC8_9GAMM|nr:fimbrial protein [Providencia alcalifaciens]TCT30988.1 type 1 fimbria pilin [Providencia alcalifaciens]